MKKHRIRGINRLSLLNNLSTAYHEMGDCKTAIKLAEECLEQVKLDDPDDYDTRAMFTINYAEYLKDSGETGKAGSVLTSMLEWLDRIQFGGFICDYYLRWAIFEYENGNKKEGGKYIDKALAYIPKDFYPLPIYDDLRKLEYIIVRKGDKRRAGKITGLMESFADNSKGKTEQFIALRAIADYYHNIGDSVKAAELYIRVDRLYEDRMKEFKRSQYKITKMMHEAEIEIQRLNRKMQKE